MKFIFPVITGIFLTLSFPPFSIPYLSFFSLIPLLIALKDTSSKDAFKIGFLGGLSHFLTLLYWIPYPISKYGNVPIYLSIWPYMLLCSYLSLFFAIFCWLSRIGDNLPLIFYPSCWIFLEFLRAKLLTGFPWCLIGYSLYKDIYLIQIADISGIYGLSFIVVLINVFIYFLLTKKLRSSHLILTSIIILFTYAYGVYSLKERPFKGKEIKAAIIQGNIDQSLKWTPSYQDRTIEIYLGLTRKALEKGAKLIIWPETAIPFYFQDDGILAKNIYEISRRYNAIMLLGSPAYKKKDGKVYYFNRAYLISSGRLISFYDKVHLVPFGEYIPLKNVLFFINRLVPSAGDFSSGKGIYPVKYRDISAGVMICYEAIFPDIARIHVKRGANLLINISNDAWFGRTSAPYQHLSMAVLRAVENRRFLIRTTNTGISAFIDPYGRILKRALLFERKFLIANVKLINYKTFYNHFGDMIIYFCSSFVLFILIKNARLHKRNF